MERQRNFECYDGPPVWILSPDCQRLMYRIPDDGSGVKRCYMRMADNKIIYDIRVIANVICHLPEPYTPRDIRVIGPLKD